MIDGTIYENAFFRVEPDFAGGTAKLKDAWIGYKNVPLFGNVRVGHQKEPMGLDQLTSDNYVDFIEIGLPVNAFTPDRNWGAMLYNSQLNKRLDWAVGIFRDVDDYGAGAHDDGYVITGRIAGRPLLSADKSMYLHLGVSGSYRKPNNGMYSVSSIPEDHLAPKFVDTKSFATNTVDLYGLEAAIVLGPVDIQAEFLGAHTDPGNMSGYYVEGGWWITGEHPNYDADNGIFGRVSPKNNFDPAKGTWGGFKVNARYSNLDLDAGTVKGGKVKDVSVGLNWQLNPNMRIMLDGIHSMPEGKGSCDMLLLRTQVDF
jgi:phosphate-selective porin OprO/OprP